MPDDDDTPLLLFSAAGAHVGTFRNSGDLYAFLTEHNLPVASVTVVPAPPESPKRQEPYR